MLQISRSHAVGIGSFQLLRETFPSATELEVRDTFNGQHRLRSANGFESDQSRVQIDSVPRALQCHWHRRHYSTVL